MIYVLMLRGVPIGWSRHRERCVEEMATRTAAEQADMTITPDVEELT